MILHNVLLKPKPDTTSDQIAAALERVRTLQIHIPGLIAVKAGENLNKTNNQGYTFGFVMHFTDLEHLKAYAPHPEHVVVAHELISICESIIDFDIEQP